MDALGTNCFSETCPVLKMQPADDLLKCRKQQQAKENIGDTCKYCDSRCTRKLFLIALKGLSEIPGNVVIQ
jgi:hypothetical protein